MYAPQKAHRRYAVTGDLAERFWSRVSKADGCWLWTGTMRRDGSLLMWDNSRMPRKAVFARRLSWFLHRGELPRHRHIIMTCDNAQCVNPEHMALSNSSSHCLRGHPLPAKRVGNRNGRHCLQCQKIRDAARYRRLKSAAL